MVYHNPMRLTAVKQLMTDEIFAVLARMTWRNVLCCAALLLFSVLPARAALPIAEDEKSAVILAYQRIGEDTVPDISLKTDQFREQVEEIISGGYNVLSFGDLLDHLASGASLPAKSLVLTFDGPFRSAFDNAFPLLIERKIPFTVFLTPQLLDDASPQSVGWADIEALARHDFISFGLHPYAYARLGDQPEATIAQNLHMAIDFFAAHLPDRAIAGFSYPFGEFSDAYIEALESAGFRAAVTSSSGVSYAGIDMLRLPRFVMTENYGQIDRFRMVANAAPLPTANWSPQNTLIPLSASDGALDTLSFQVTDALPSLDLMRCYVSGQDAPHIEHDRHNLVVLKLAQPLTEGRIRVNCTMPGPQPDDILEAPRYRWYGQLYAIQ